MARILQIRLLPTPSGSDLKSILELLSDEDELLMDSASNLLWDPHNATLDSLDSFNCLGSLASDLLALGRKFVDSLLDVISSDAYFVLKVREKAISRQTGLRLVGIFN
jgi:hypothetical protein